MAAVVMHTHVLVAINPLTVTLLWHSAACKALLCHIKLACKMLLIYKKRAAKQTKRLALRKCTYCLYFSSYSSEI